MNTTTTLKPASLQAKKGKLVDTNHVDQLISNYKKERWVQNSEKIGKPDALSTWYGLNELLSFLDLAKENQADGIKMYYGVYPGDFAGDPELQGRQTVVLVATKQKMTAQGNVNKDIYINKGGKSEILAFNYGNVCPPFCFPGLFDSQNVASGLETSKIGITLIQKDNQIIVL